MNEFEALSIIIDTAIKHARHNQKTHGRRRGGAYVQSAMDFGDPAAAAGVSTAGGASSDEYSRYELTDAGYKPSKRAIDIVAQFAAMESKDDDRLRLFDRERAIGRQTIDLQQKSVNTPEEIDQIRKNMAELERLSTEYIEYDGKIRPEIMLGSGNENMTSVVPKGHPAAMEEGRTEDILVNFVSQSYQNDPEKWNNAIKTANKAVSGMIPSKDPLNGEKIKVYPLAEAGGSAYIVEKKYIYISQPTMRTAVHEMAHAVEMNNPKIIAKALQYFEQRVAGEEPRVLSDVYNDYDLPVAQTTRTGYKDRFVHPYIGVNYQDKSGKRFATEVLSVGLDLIVSDPVNFAKRDPEHFAFVLDILQDPSNYERP